MKFNKNLLKEKWFSYTVALCSAVILYLLLTHLSGLVHFLGSIWKVIAPVVMAFVVAYVIAPLVRIYSRYVLNNVYPDRLRHVLSVLLAVLTVVFFFVILMVALIPQVIDSIVLFVGNLNGYVLSFQRLMRQLSSFAAHHDIDMTPFISSSDELLQSITRVLPENLNKIVNVSYGFGAKLFEWIISFILAIYLMMDGEKLKTGFKRLLHALLPTHAYSSTASFWRRCNRILIQYIAFDILDGMIIGLLNWIFMVIMHMPYVAIISVIVAVTNLAPTFGPMVGAVLGAFILVLANPLDALWFLLFTLVLQTIDGYVIKPRLFGEQLGVSSVWILISLIIGGRLLGVPGILLAIPFAAIGDFVYHDYVIQRLEEQKQERRLHKQAAESGRKKAAEITAEAMSQLAGETVASAEAIAAGETGAESIAAGETDAENSSAGETGAENIAAGETTTENIVADKTSAENIAADKAVKENTAADETDAVSS